MAAKQRDISVSEFFTKNRHLLGFDNPSKALLTTIKEAVDNSLDACEEAGILPEVVVSIDAITEERFRVTIEDNGPGIVKANIPKVFGKLLYGSKFHRLKQQRGQQGIGISAAAMYGQLTTGRPVQVLSCTDDGKPAHYYEIAIDTKSNAPVIRADETRAWDRPHGTSVTIELAASHKKGRHSIDDYLRDTAIVNPHATIRYRAPDGESVVYERQSAELPPEAKEIKPHPYGVELGLLMRMLADTKSRTVRAFFQDEFSRVSGKIADEICAAANVSTSMRPREAAHHAEALHLAIPKVKIIAPPATSVVPIGEELITKGLRAQWPDCDLIVAATRPPEVYRGNPFRVEAGLAFGGKLPGDEPIKLLRFANRVPLLYQQSACAIARSVITTGWRNYALQQPRGALPLGPMVLVVHIASAWVPFTSESKEAIAHYPEIIKEVRLALCDVGRKLGAHLRHRRRALEDEKKRAYITKYLPHIGIALREMLALSEKDESKVTEKLVTMLERSRA
jgi:DNA topoisomerase-6 subunit B